MNKKWLNSIFRELLNWLKPVINLKKKLKNLKPTKWKWKTYAAEREALYVHDAKLGDGASQWVVNLRASVRPIITYIFVFLLLFTDVVGLIWAINSGVDFATAMNTVFSSEEMAIVASIIGFWFGSRHWDK
jgi:hypothetical protein